MLSVLEPFDPVDQGLDAVALGIAEVFELNTDTIVGRVDNVAVDPEDIGKFGVGEGQGQFFAHGEIFIGGDKHAFGMNVFDIIGIKAIADGIVDDDRRGLARVFGPVACHGIRGAILQYRLFLRFALNGFFQFHKSMLMQ